MALLPGARSARASAGLIGAVLTVAVTSRAQQRTFQLDRLQVPGGPDDGVVLFRSVTQPGPVLFGQLGLGYAVNPLHTGNVTRDRSVLERSPSGVIQGQFITYATVGFQLLNRVTLAASLPVTLGQYGENPSYASTVFGSATRTTPVATGGAAANDMRLDFRAVGWRSADGRGAVGGQVSVMLPTGSTTNFGGDGEASIMPMVSGEYALLPYLVVGGQTGFHFRPRNSINDPARDAGLGIGDEWRWAVGAFVPIRSGKYRIGATVFGQTGIESDSRVIGSTAFTGRNTPVEWHLEGRVKFGPREQWWAGVGGGTLLASGYGAPDFRAVALVGTYIPIGGSSASSPDPREALRRKWQRDRQEDRDHDGIPDDIDACPDEAEDGKGMDPEDGCPAPPDRDNDGIPDDYDKCPDQAEDFDQIDDGDGCPETDADRDGIADAEDACPKEPGQTSPDPKRNGCPIFISMEGSIVRVLQQVHFATASTTILPDSFGMLQEVANLLKVNPNIQRMSIEGHTDDRGPHELNMKLSQGRAESVMNWLVKHGVEQSRLEAHGYGETQPISDNKTDKGRATNRRVEFKILDEYDPNKMRKE